MALYVPGSSPFGQVANTLSALYYILQSRVLQHESGITCTCNFVHKKVENVPMELKHPRVLCHIKFFTMDKRKIACVLYSYVGLFISIGL